MSEEIKLLKNSDLTNKEKAKKLGVGYRTFLNYLNGKEIPSYMKKLIQHEFSEKNNSAQEPTETYSLVQELQQENKELKRILMEKEQTIDLQNKIINLLENKIN